MRLILVAVAALHSLSLAGLNTPRFQIFEGGELAFGDAGFESGVRISPIVGDITGDGAPDIITIERNGDEVCLARSVGRGQWAAPVPVLSFDGALRIYDALATDSNSDGMIDIAYWGNSTAKGSVVVGVFLGDGAGNFEARPPFAISGGLEVPYSNLSRHAYIDTMAAGDVTGDGYQDLIVSSGGLVIVYGDGDGSFTTWRRRVHSHGSVVLVDLNGDSTYEILGGSGSLRLTRLVENEWVNEFHAGGAGTSSPILDTYMIPRPDGLPGVRGILTYKLDGGTAIISADIAPDYTSTPGPTAFTAEPYAPAVTGDLLGGPGQDFVMSNGIAFIDIADDTFGAPIELFASSEGLPVILDMNLDGIADLVRVNPAGIAVQSVDQIGEERSIAPARFEFVQGAGSPENAGIGSGDFDGDGLDDIFVSTKEIPTSAVFYQNPDGSFESQILPLTAPAARVHVVDLDRDGLDDVVLPTTGTRVQANFAMLGRAFTPRMGFDTGLGGLLVVQTGDVDGDGLLDIAAQSSDGIAVLVQESAREFVLSHTIAEPDARIGLALGDIDGDGDDDIAFGARPEFGIGLMISGGDGTFLPPSFFVEQPAPEVLRFADIDMDGDLDLISVAGLETDVIVVYQNDGSGSFSAVHVYSTGCGENIGPQSGEVSDVNGDGLPDLVVGCGGGEVRVFLGNGKSELTLFASALSHGEEVNQIAIADLNGDGRPDIAAPVGVKMTEPDEALVGFQLLENLASPRYLCPADLAPPAGSLDLADIVAFIDEFVDASPLADIAPRFGVIDFADVDAFVAALLKGCD